MSESATAPATLQCTFSNVQQKSVARKKKLVTLPHARRSRPCRSSASSSTRVRRETFARHSPAELGRLERAGTPAVAQRRQLAGDPVDVLGRDDDAGAGLAQQLGRGAVGRHERQDRPLRGEVLEHLPGEHAAAAAAGLGDQQQQRLGVALQLERAPVRRVGDQLDAVDDPGRPFAVGRAEVADEARDDAVDAGERGQERPRVALAEERAGVRDPERGRAPGW